MRLVYVCDSKTRVQSIRYNELLVCYMFVVTVPI